MLDKIYNYAKSNNLYPKIGYQKKLISAYILLDKNSNFLGLDIKDKKDKEKTLCPDIGKLAYSGNKCNLIIEKIKYAFFKEETKNDFYNEIIEQCAEFDENVDIINKFLKKNKEDEIFTNFIKNEILEKKIKDDCFISYRIEETNIEDIDSWKLWFDKYLEEKTKKLTSNTQISLLSGESIDVMNISKDSPLISVPEVNGTGDYVFSLGKKSFESYGQKTVNIGKEEANIIKAGLENLLNKNHYNKNFGIIHWYKENINKEDIIFDFFNYKEQQDTELEEENEKKDILLNKLFECIEKGFIPNDEIKEDTYYSAKYISCGGRFFLSNYKEGSFKQLYKNLFKWYKDTSIEYIFYDDKNQIRTISFIKNIYNIFFTLLENKDAKDKNKQIESEFGDSKLKLLYSIFDDDLIPIKYLYKALKCVKKSINNNEKINKLAIQIIKVYLIRKKKGDNIIMEVLNKDNKDTAYNCGRMFAVYEQIQYEAQNNLNKNIVDNYFSSAQLATSYIMVKLSKLSMYHMKKLPEYTKIRYMKLLEEISSNIESFPKKLNIEEQGMFVLGYYQQRNDLFKKQNN